LPAQRPARLCDALPSAQDGARDQFVAPTNIPTCVTPLSSPLAVAPLPDPATLAGKVSGLGAHADRLIRSRLDKVEPAAPGSALPRPLATP
jgi:hypothetical protein